MPADGVTTEMPYLRQLVEQGGRRRYGDRPAPHEDLSLRARAWAQIDHELDVIEQLGFPGYFLVVWDIVEFCRRSDIFCQGRGSAANSAVCYALGITKADAVSLGLLFERFLSPERDGPPDIDIDIESDRREEVIQYVYAALRPRTTPRRWPTSSPTGPRRRCATWPRRSATRPASRTRGRKQVDAWGNVSTHRRPARPRHPRGRCSSWPREVEDCPRHLGIHSGGMVHLRPAGDRGVPGRVGAHGRAASCCSGTRTTAPRPAW